jgi:hypothetical protein
MVQKKLSLITTCLGIFSTIIIFFSYGLAEENKIVVDHEGGAYYTIQKGDTLWDLSNRFSDSPWLWPDLWEENPQIPNPHLIYPGERIRLLYNKGVETESIESVVKAVESEPVVLEPEKKAPFYQYAAIDHVGFIRKTPVTPQGIIFKVKGDHTKISQDDIVYIKPTGDTTLSPGSRHTVYRTFDPIIDKATKENIGTQHYLTGFVEITEVEPEFAIARVVRSYRTIEINDRIMPYQRRSPKIILMDTVKGLKGKILFAEEHQVLIGDNHVVFIDKGDKDGIKPGQQYNVYYQEKQLVDAASKEDVTLTPVVFGNLLVLLTQETTATALITNSQKNIAPGDKISSPMP